MPENFDAMKYVEAFFTLVNALIKALEKPEEGEEKSIIDSLKAAINAFLATIGV